MGDCQPFVETDGWHTTRSYKDLERISFVSTYFSYCMIMPDKSCITPRPPIASMIIPHISTVNIGQGLKVLIHTNH